MGRDQKSLPFPQPFKTQKRLKNNVKKLLILTLLLASCSPRLATIQDGQAKSAEGIVMCDSTGRVTPKYEKYKTTNRKVFKTTFVIVVGVVVIVIVAQSPPEISTP